MSSRKGRSSSSSSSSNLVKNRAPAPIQISAEQILREAVDRQDESSALKEPIVKIHDKEEYQAHVAERRGLFEKNIRYRREDIGNWVKYARFEEEQAADLERARSVFERALEVSNHAQLWLRYAEMELRQENINHARNILDRAVQLWPRVDYLWYKYVYIEEMMQDVPKCRAVFQRWMKWRPDDNAWLSFARFETRNGDLQRAEQVMREYINAYPCARAFCRFAKWAEWEAKNVDLARQILQAALQELPTEEAHQARLLQQFAALEERAGEYERARVIYQHAVQLLKLPPSADSSDGSSEDLTDWERQKRQELYQAYLTFEKKHGTAAGVEQVVLTQKRVQYQKTVQENAYNYDAWFEWAKLEEQQGNVESVRNVYEKAVANVPPSDQKQDWKRYIYLWIYYAVYEELTNQDLHRAAQVYETCLKLIPHAQFSFAKIWILAAQVHVRAKDLIKARKLLGQAIGKCGKERIFVEYIALELALGEIDRCRQLYTNYLKAMPHNGQVWTKYAQLEQSVGEIDRCRALYELATEQPALDRPEILWKAYIDFEIEQGEADRARKLYERLLEKTQHVKVWISLAQFEATVAGMEAARQVMEQAYQQLKQDNLSEERVLLLDAWRVLEQEHGTSDSIAQVEAKMPRRIKRKRLQRDEQGNEVGWEEYFDYQFPDDEDARGASNFKILEMAAKWKAAGGDSDDSDMDSDGE